MTTKRIFEAGSLVESKTDAGKFRIRIITEGEGSSGVYSRELLEQYGEVFGGRAMFGNHPKDPNKPWERSPFEIKAKLGPKVEYEVVDGKGTLYAEPIMSPEIAAWVEEFKDVIGVSIFASGEGHDEDGKWIVESFDGSDPYTSVDFVVAPGRGGGVERVMEAWRTLEDSTAPAGADEGKERTTMDEAVKLYLESLFSKLDEKIVTLQESIDGAVTLVESVRDAQPERVEAVTTAGELATAVAEAQLGEKAVQRVLEAVTGGKSVTDAVKYEKDIKDEVLAEAKNRLQEGVFGAGSDTDFADVAISSVRFN